MLRTCKVCTQQKPYDPTAKRESPAMGFVGYTCYACYRLKCNLRYAGLEVTDPNAIAQQAEHKALRKRQKQESIRAVSKPYGIMVQEAQIALDNELQTSLPSQKHLGLLEKNLAYAKRKLELFGADAFDYQTRAKFQND